MQDTYNEKNHIYIIYEDITHERMLLYCFQYRLYKQDESTSFVKNLDE